MERSDQSTQPNNDKKQQQRQRFKKISAIVKLVLLLIIVIGIPAYLFFFDHQFLDRFSSIDDVYAFFLQYKSQSILIYLGLQILQIVICIIPGQALQLAAGYLFHFWLGLILSVVGAAMGTVVTYYLAKVLGHDAMHMIFGEEKIQSALEKINSKRGVVVSDPWHTEGSVYLRGGAFRDEAETVSDPVPDGPDPGDDRLAADRS